MSQFKGATFENVVQEGKLTIDVTQTWLGSCMCNLGQTGSQKTVVSNFSSICQIFWIHDEAIMYIAISLYLMCKAYL